jgi:hypothetical protein
MNQIRIALTAALCLLCGAFAHAQEPGDAPKPPQHEETRPEPKREAAPQDRQDEVKSPKHDHDNDRRQEEARPPKQENEKPPRSENAKPPREEARPDHDQHDQQAREREHPGGRGARIPDEKFHASFGRPHTFVVHRTVIVEGRPRFQYSGFWFEFVDAWPGDWTYDDDVYVDYIDGEYFLFNLRHPGVRIAVFVVP